MWTWKGYECAWDMLQDMLDRCRGVMNSPYDVMFAFSSPVCIPRTEVDHACESVKGDQCCVLIVCCFPLLKIITGCTLLRFTTLAVLRWSHPFLQVLRALGVLLRHSPFCLEGGPLESLSLSMWSLFHHRPKPDIQIAVAELLAVVLLSFQDSHVQELQKDPDFDIGQHNHALDRFCHQQILEPLREALPSQTVRDSVSSTVNALDNLLTEHLASKTAQSILDHVRYCSSFPSDLTSRPMMALGHITDYKPCAYV
jgi:hypothetical protein